METLPEIKRSTKIQGIKRNYLCLISKIAPRLANNPLFKKCLMEFKRSGCKYNEPEVAFIHTNEHVRVA